MNNPVGVQASREEEIAFLALEQVLGVEILLADAGAGNEMPDGAWVSSGEHKRRGVIEVTSPPSRELMATWARAKRSGERQVESGSVPLRWGELAQVCNELLEAEWAYQNIAKLLHQSAEERHLFLFARSHDVANYFYRLSASYDDGLTEAVEDLDLPQGLTDVWFRGRAERVADSGTTKVWLARYQVGSGWRRHNVQIEEQQLPSPNRSIADDCVLPGWRQPKKRG